MGDDQEYGGGYDDIFDDGLFSTTVRTSARERPHMWPKSASEMRSHTSYGEQRMTDGYGDGDWYSSYMLRRGPAPAYNGGGANYASGPPAYWRDSGIPRGGERPGRDNGGYWLHQPYGPPVWVASGR